MPDRKWFKGTAAQAIDDWYSTGDVEANLHAANDLLAQEDLSFMDIVEQLGDRWRSDLFPYPLTGGRLAGDEFEAVARAGYRKAIELALLHDGAVPIQTFWMTGAGNTHFEMHVSDGAQAVTVTVVVPDVEGGSRDEGMPEAWVIHAEGRGQVHVSQTSGPPNK